MDYEKIAWRYSQNYITDAQLVRFKNLGIITEDQYAALYAETHPAEQGDE